MKKSLPALIVLGLLTPHMARAVDVRQMVYQYARQGNVQAIRQMQRQGYSLEMMDSHGNTPICEAALRGDQHTVNVLAAMGANTRPNCWNRLPPAVANQMRPQPMVAHMATGPTADIVAQNTTYVPQTIVAEQTTQAPVMQSERPSVYAPTKVVIPNKFPVGWAALAAVGAGAGTALLFSSLGGSSNKKDPLNATPVEEDNTCDTEVYNLAAEPQNADFISCVTKEGKVRFRIIGCNENYVMVNNVCVVAQCGGYPLLLCPDHGVCSECDEVNGRKRYALSSCATGYVKSGTSCEVIPEDPEEKLGVRYGVKGYANMSSDKPGDTVLYFTKGNVNEGSTVYQDVYGVWDNTDKQLHNAYTSGTASAPTRTIKIEHNGKGTDYGMYSTNVAMNARAETGNKATTGTITMTKNANGNVYGIYASRAVNVYLKGAENTDKESSGAINITRTNITDNSTATGLYGTVYAANAVKGMNYKQTATGTITIKNTSSSGAGIVRGVVSKGTGSNQGYAYNALMVPILTNSNVIDKPTTADYTMTMYGHAHGTIAITNTGNSMVIGVDGYARAANGYKDVLAKTENASSGNVKGTIEITNTGNGDIYGVRATNGPAFNMWNSKGADAVGTIEIKQNQGNGNVFGVYATGTVYNGRYLVNDHNNATDGNMKNIATITMGSMVSDTDITPTDKLSGSGNVMALVSTEGGVANGYLRTGTDTGATTSVIEEASITILHTTPASVTKDTSETPIYIRGISSKTVGYNSEAHIGSIVKPANLTSAISIRENNLSSVSRVVAEGAYVSGGSFYNAYHDYATTAQNNMKGTVKGNIFINATHGTGRADATGARASTSAYNAYTTANVSAGSTAARIVIRSETLGYGIQGGRNSSNIVANAYSLSTSSSTTTSGYIEATGNWGLRGMVGGGVSYNAFGKATGEINVIKGAEKKPTDDINGSLFGMEGTTLYNAHDSGSTGTIAVLSHGTGNAYGMYGTNVYSGAGTSTITVVGIPVIEGEIATGGYRGMAGVNAGGVVENKGTINVNLIGPLFSASGGSNQSNSTVPTEDNSTAMGIYGALGVTITNSGNINIQRATYTSKANKDTSSESSTTWTPTGNYTGGKAYGIYSEGNAIITNNKKITVTDKIEKGYGIYVKDGTNTKITNSTNGEIAVGAKGYGIYIAENGGSATISNAGKITVGTKSCTGTACTRNNEDGHSTYGPASLTTNGGVTSFDQFIHLGGAALDNNALISSDVPIDFDAVDGEMNIGVGGVYEAPALTGTLSVNNDVVTAGFDEQYTLNDALKADDLDGLNVHAKSALFSASVENGSDIVLTKKDFNNFTKNNSLAEFLENNYAGHQNEKLFATLKNVESVSELKQSLKTLSGQKMFGHLGFEDMTMARELNANMNHQLFTNKKDKFEMVNEVQPLAFKNNNGSRIRYSLMNKRVGNKSIGLGIAFTDIASDEGQNKNKRRENQYQMMVPLGYHKGKMQLVTAPKLGYARATYDRAGFNNTTHNGVIEKRMYGLANEARYTIDVGDWKLAPAAEFNVFGYQQKGHETRKAFSLNIPTQNTFSMESGFGLHAAHETELGKGIFNLNASLMAYHEFANPYDMRLQMQGMRGSFVVHDEDATDNRAVLRAGFNYAADDLSVYGDLVSELRDKLNTGVKTGVKVEF